MRRLREKMTKIKTLDTLKENNKQITVRPDQQYGMIMGNETDMRNLNNDYIKNDEVKEIQIKNVTLKYF